MPDNLLWRVPFKISGYVEIRARDGEDAWEKVHTEFTPQDLIDLPGVKVRFQRSRECQE